MSDWRTNLKAVAIFEREQRRTGDDVYAAEYAGGFHDAQVAEDARWAGILRSEQARGRWGAATALAQAGLSVEVARSLLNVMPRTQSLAERMAASEASIGFVAQSAPSQDHGWGDIVAGVNKQLGLSPGEPRPDRAK